MTHLGSLQVMVFSSYVGEKEQESILTIGFTKNVMIKFRVETVCNKSLTYSMGNNNKTHPGIYKSHYKKIILLLLL